MLEGIIESGNHYLIQVKRNQPSLFQELGDMLAERPLDIFEQTEKGHGRHSHWTVSVFDMCVNAIAHDPDLFHVLRLSSLRRFAG